MTKTHLFRVNTCCSGDGPAIYEFVRYKEDIKKADVERVKKKIIQID